MYAYGSAMSHASRAVSLADADSERALAQRRWAMPSGWPSTTDDAWSSYQQALEHAERSGPERPPWPGCGGSSSTCRRAGARAAGDEGRAGPRARARAGDAKALGDRALEARFLSPVRSTWSGTTTDAGGAREALADARTAQAIGVELDRPAIQSAARDAEGVMLLIRVGRYAEARRSGRGSNAPGAAAEPPGGADRRLHMVAGRGSLRGDYAAAVEATDRAAGWPARASGTGRHGRSCSVRMPSSGGIAGTRRWRRTGVSSASTGAPGRAGAVRRRRGRWCRRGGAPAARRA